MIFFALHKYRSYLYLTLKHLFDVIEREIREARSWFKVFETKLISILSRFRIKIVRFKARAWRAAVSVSLSNCLYVSVSMSICFPAFLSLCLFLQVYVSMSVGLCMHMYQSLSLCLFVSLSLCLFVSLSLCLSVSLSLCLFVSDRQIDR